MTYRKNRGRVRRKMHLVVEKVQLKLAKRPATVMLQGRRYNFYREGVYEFHLSNYGLSGLFPFCRQIFAFFSLHNGCCQLAEAYTPYAPDRVL